MKYNKRTQWLSMIALLSLVLPSAALEQRLFKSADQTKTFTATLLEYNEAKRTVAVRIKGGDSKRFSIDLLSADDQKYVMGSAGELAVSRSVNVSFKEVKGETARSKSGRVRTSSTPISYDIQVYNRSDQVIKDLEVRYSFYYCVGSSTVNGPRHSPKVQKGSLIYPKLFGKYNETRPTANVVLVRESQKKILPPSGGGGRAGGGG
jgi:hypothetical protein